MQQRSTGRCSTVDSRRRLTNFKMSVSQCQQSRDSLSHNCQMLNQVLIIVSSGTCQQFVEDAAKINIFGFSNFTRQCSNILQLRRKSLCVYIQNFLANQLVKEFSKSVHICRSYDQTLRGILFWDTVYICHYSTSSVAYLRIALGFSVRDCQFNSVQCHFFRFFVLLIFRRQLFIVICHIFSLTFVLIITCRCLSHESRQVQ